MTLEKLDQWQEDAKDYLDAHQDPEKFFDLYQPVAFVLRTCFLNGVEILQDCEVKLKLSEETERFSVDAARDCFFTVFGADKIEIQDFNLQRILEAIFDELQLKTTDRSHSLAFQGNINFLLQTRQLNLINKLTI